MINLSTKELNYVKDILSWELVMAKKCNQYSMQETDPKFKQIFAETGQMHQQNYINAFNYLQQVNNSQGGGLH